MKALWKSKVLIPSRPLCLVFMSTLSGQSNKSFLWWAMFYRTSLGVVQSIPNRDPGCSEAYIKDPEHGASTGSWLYVPEARAVSCDMNWPLSMNPGSRKKLQCIHDPSLIGLFNYIPLRKLKLIKLLHDIDETGTGPSMVPMLYILFPWGESNPNTERTHSLLVLSLPKRITAAPEFEIFDFCQFFCNSTQNDPHY